MSMMQADTYALPARVLYWRWQIIEWPISLAISGDPAGPPAAITNQQKSTK